MNLTIAWLAQGKIRLKNGDEPPRTLESQFGQSIRERAAKGVLAYDLAPDGSVVYSNGNAIYSLDTSGRTRRIVVESMIEQVVVLTTEPSPGQS
jgi:hypothetical protein